MTQEITTHSLILIAPKRDGRISDVAFGSVIDKALRDFHTDKGRLHVFSWVPDGDEGLEGIEKSVYLEQIREGVRELPEGVVRGGDGWSSTDDGWSDRAKEKWRLKVVSLVHTAGDDDRVYPLRFV